LHQVDRLRETMLKHKNFHLIKAPDKLNELLRPLGFTTVSGTDDDGISFDKPTTELPWGGQIQWFNGEVKPGAFVPQGFRYILHDPLKSESVKVDIKATLGKIFHAHFVTREQPNPKFEYSAMACPNLLAHFEGDFPKELNHTITYTNHLNTLELVKQANRQFGCFAKTFEAQKEFEETPAIKPVGAVSPLKVLSNKLEKTFSFSATMVPPRPTQ
jgi:hypothetical protein